MTQNVPKERNILRKKARRRKVIELKGTGKTIAEISQELGVSDTTIDRDLKSQDTQAFLDELVRQQIIDLQQAKLPMRLHFRSDLLDKLLPKKMEQKIEGGETVRFEIVDNSKDPEVSASPATT
jgi:IS30 family transposase